LKLLRKLVVDPPLLQKAHEPIVDLGTAESAESHVLRPVGGTVVYDRFMCLLEERGIDNEFAKQLQALATAHEHRCYIRSLKDIVDLISL
jgi:hypothetical protein